MTNLPTVFVSYNPKSNFERTLAIRLHTLGGVHGYKMYLPDRTKLGTGVSSETKTRIRASDYFILFSTSTPSKTVQEEISIAWEHLHNKAHIILIYDKPKGKHLTGTDKCTEITIDSDTMSFDQINKHVIGELALLNLGIAPNRTKQKKKEENVVGGLILAGLALLLLGALLEPEK